MNQNIFFKTKYISKTVVHSSSYKGEKSTYISNAQIIYISVLISCSSRWLGHLSTRSLYLLHSFNIIKKL
jgi:hypothetical protein